MHAKKGGREQVFRSASPPSTQHNTRCHRCKCDRSLKGQGRGVGLSTADVAVVAAEALVTLAATCAGRRAGFFAIITAAGTDPSPDRCKCDGLVGGQGGRVGLGTADVAVVAAEALVTLAATCVVRRAGFSVVFTTRTETIEPLFSLEYPHLGPAKAGPTKHTLDEKRRSIVSVRQGL